jgi:hypothetical protein
MGVDSPYIDFGQGIPELANIVQDADLLVLEGIGKLLHRNFNAHIEAFTHTKSLTLAQQFLKGSV